MAISVADVEKTVFQEWLSRPKWFTITTTKEKEEIEPQVHSTAVISDDVKIGSSTKIMAKVVIEDGAVIGKNVVLYPGVYIGKDVSIGDNTLVRANVTIRERSEIGSRVMIDSGSVIGSDGFGFAPCEDGSRKKIPQVGKVIIEDDVVIGSNVTIDRATMGRTWIKKGCRIDSLVQVAHNVVIGERTVVRGQVGICGSVEIGEQVIVGQRTGIAGHLKVGDRTKIAAGSGISKTVPADSNLAGYPALPVEEDRQLLELRQNLPELYEKVKTIESAIQQL